MPCSRGRCVGRDLSGLMCRVFLKESLDLGSPMVAFVLSQGVSYELSSRYPNSFTASRSSLSVHFVQPDVVPRGSPARFLHTWVSNVTAVSTPLRDGGYAYPKLVSLVVVSCSRLVVRPFKYVQMKCCLEVVSTVVCM